MEYKADPLIVNDENQNAIMIATALGNTKSMLAILHFCTFDLCAAQGTQLLEIAKNSGFEETIAALEQEKSEQRFSKSKNARNTVQRRK